MVHAPLWHFASSPGASTGSEIIWLKTLFNTLSITSPLLQEDPLIAQLAEQSASEMWPPHGPADIGDCRSCHIARTRCRVCRPRSIPRNVTGICRRSRPTASGRLGWQEISGYIYREGHAAAPSVLPSTELISKPVSCSVGSASVWSAERICC